MTTKSRIIDINRAVKKNIVVVVDDQPTICSIISEMLRSATKGNCVVKTFFSACPALDFINSNKVDLILADCKMPDLNGIDFARLVRAKYSAEELPIIMITMYDDMDRYEALAAGVNGFEFKPLQAKTFKLRIQDFLKKQDKLLVSEDSVI